MKVLNASAKIFPNFILPFVNEREFIRDMKKELSPILLVIFFSFNLFGQAITKEEYEIYSIVLENIYQKSLGPFVILDETEVSNYSVSLNDSVEKDFRRKNKVSVQLNSSFPTNIKYWVVNKSEIRQLLNEGRKDFEKIQKDRKNKGLRPYAEPDDLIIWKYFVKKYPYAGCYSQFSRIGFSSNKRFAKVEITEISIGGSIKTYFLSKNKGRWKISKSYEQSWSH